MTQADPAAGQQMTVMVVIPTYNECENIERIVTDVLALPCAPRVLIVDDNSPDGTGQIADKLAARHPGCVDVLHRASKDGLGRAYVAGFQKALQSDARLIAQMDADYSHSPTDLQRLVEVAIETGADLVLGSRYVEGGKTIGWPWPRKAISRFGGWYSGHIVGVGVKDLTGGFKVWRRETLQDIELSSIRADGYGFQVETTYRALSRHHTVEQVPITFHDRVAGKSKLSRRVVFEAAILAWQLRWRQVTGKRW
jgi:dolichol-phosphate mannosyltransferase